MRRGSLNSAEEITGHKYETLGRWLRQSPAYAEAITDALTHDLHLSAGEVAAFWSFVHQSITSGIAGSALQDGRKAHRRQLRAFAR
jgi:hypothetical protein